MKRIANFIDSHVVLVGAIAGLCMMTGTVGGIATHGAHWQFSAMFCGGLVTVIVCMMRYTDRTEKKMPRIIQTQQWDEDE